MLTTEKLKLVQELANSSSKEEIAWISGYFSAIASVKTLPENQLVSSASATNKITIAYGTETGNSKKLATAFAATARKKGIQAKLVSLEQYRITDLPKEEYFFTVISTQGEGEPPAAAQKFYDHIHQNGFKVNNLKYGVLALGDTTYPLFCKAGEDIDQQLQKLGGERLVTLQKCDTDYESEATVWIEEVLQRLQQSKSEPFVSAPKPFVKPKSKKTYTGTIVKNINLNDRGSNKQTHHIEVIAEDLEYEPGDSIGIIPSNPSYAVQAVLELSGLNADTLIEYKGQNSELRFLLESKLNIMYLPERVVRLYANLVEQDIPVSKIGLAQLLKIYPLAGKEQFSDLIQILEPLTPRLYSISSSKEAHGEEVHITVARDQFQVNEEWQCGLCSNHLISLNEGALVEFYIHKNREFRLPAADKDVIMIGPGTGIAPFRSFLSERDATGASGRNWLFFGEQYFVTDFLYQSEIQSWLSTGVLTKVNVSFSRDQPEKIYVQHKMQKHGEELFKWIRAGAYVYICGAKDPMSIDVENTLLEIFSRHGSLSKESAAGLLDILKEEGRYRKDVY